MGGQSGGGLPIHLYTVADAAYRAARRQRIQGDDGWKNVDEQIISALLFMFGIFVDIYCRLWLILFFLR